MHREKPLLLLVFRGIICAQVPPLNVHTIISRVISRA
jgi:hypothetical protein